MVKALAGSSASMAAAALRVGPFAAQLAMAAAAATMPATAGTGRGRGGGSCAGRGERGKLLGQLLRAAVRAFRALPFTGADEDFAVPFAFFAMKFVNRHEGIITATRELFKRHRRERK